MKNYYEILCIGQDATLDDIRKAHRGKVMQFNPERSRRNKRTFDDLVEAYETLSRINSRIAYDLVLSGSLDKAKIYTGYEQQEINSNEIIAEQIKGLYRDVEKLNSTHLRRSRDILEAKLCKFDGEEKVKVRRLIDHIEDLYSRRNKIKQAYSLTALALGIGNIIVGNKFDYGYFDDAQRALGMLSAGQGIVWWLRYYIEGINFKRSKKQK